MAALDSTSATLGKELVELLELARAERLSVSLYRFAQKHHVAVEAYPASDFRAQHEGALQDVLLQLTTTIQTARPQVDDPLDAQALGSALRRLLEATEALTVFVTFLHPAGSEYSCRVEVLRPEPLEALVNRLAPDPLQALSSALEALGL